MATSWLLPFPICEDEEVADGEAEDEEPDAEEVEVLVVDAESEEDEEGASRDVTFARPARPGSMWASSNENGSLPSRQITSEPLLTGVPQQ